MFSDSTPSRTTTFDPDGRIASIASSTFGTDQFTYDADGRETQYQEGSGGGTTSPARVAYDYYANGQRKALSIYASALSQADEFTYDYRNDGERTKLMVAGYATPFSWSYSNAGRELTQSDPLTGTSAPAYPNWSNAVTFVPRTLQYNAYGQLSSLTLPTTGGYNNFSYDGEGNLMGASIVTPTQQLPQPSTYYQNGQSTYITSISEAYDIRAELTKETAYSAAAPRGWWNTWSDYCFGHRITHQVTPTCAGDPDPFTGATHMGSSLYVAANTLSCKNTESVSEQDTWQYDADGRQSVQPVDNQDTNSNCYINPNQVVEQRTYDAENHVVSDVCGYGEADGMIAPGCQSLTTGRIISGVVHPSTGYTVTLSYGGNARVRLANLAGSAYAPHWDGDDLLFVTDAGGTLQQINIEDLGAISYQTSPSHLTVFDRDFGGQEVAIHTSSATDSLYGSSVQWQWIVMPQHWEQSTAAFAQGIAGPPVQGCFPQCSNAGQRQLLTTNAIDWEMLFDSGRSDGYYIGGVSVQGARSYDPNTQQWSTPDAYKGDVHDPMSQRAYMWNDNNPITYSDPSGYVSVGDVALGIYNFVVGNDINTLRSSNASTAAKVVAALSLASNLAGPEAKGAEIATKAALEVGEHLVARAAEEDAGKAAFRSINQIRRDIRQGVSGTRGMEDAHAGNSNTLTQDHVHFRDGTAINRDGTQHDMNGLPKLTNKNRKYLRNAGFKV